MAKNDTTRPDQPLRETEQAAYHAFREWPILLVMREKELAALQANPTVADVEKTEKATEKPEGSQP